MRELDRFKPLVCSTGQGICDGRNIGSVPSFFLSCWSEAGYALLITEFQQRNRIPSMHSGLGKGQSQ